MYIGLTYMVEWAVLDRSICLAALCLVESHIDQVSDRDGCRALEGHAYISIFINTHCDLHDSCRTNKQKKKCV